MFIYASLMCRSRLLENDGTTSTVLHMHMDTEIMKVPHFRVGDRRIRNRFQAWIEHKKTGQPLHFDLFETAFDAADWDQEPNLTWNQLLDLRAQQIAALGRPIVLGYSGGTDSYTIYEVFKRNNVKLAAVFFRSRTNWEYDLHFRPPLEYIQKEGREHGFRVHEEKESSKWYDAFYDSPDWIWSDHNYKVQFGNGFQLNPDLDRIAPGLVSDDYVYVNGLDKPRLTVKDGRIWAYLDHNTFSCCSGNSRSEAFYVHWRLPELHIKQSYMLARYAMAQSLELNLPLKYFEKIHDPKKHDYYAYSFDGCGRFGEISYSPTQKNINNSAKLFLPLQRDAKTAFYQGRSPEFFHDGLNHGDSFALNHVHGLLNMRSDPWLRDFFDPLDLYKHPDIKSKMYALNLDISDLDRQRAILHPK